MKEYCFYSIRNLYKKYRAWIHVSNLRGGDDSRKRLCVCVSLGVNGF